MNKKYSKVKDSSADLGVNSKMVQIRPTVKAVSTKISKKIFFWNFGADSLVCVSNLDNFGINP